MTCCPNFSRILLAGISMGLTMAPIPPAVGQTVQAAAKGGEPSQDAIKTPGSDSPSPAQEDLVNPFTGRVPPPGSGCDSYPPGKEIRVVVREPYASAIGLIAQDERRYQKELREGKLPSPKRRHIGADDELNDAEDDVMRAILLDASDRIRALYKEIYADSDELGRHYSDELAAKRFALIAQLQPIYDAVPGKLKEEMGDKAFEKADFLFKAAWGRFPARTDVYYYRRVAHI